MNLRIITWFKLNRIYIGICLKQADNRILKIFDDLTEIFSSHLLNVRNMANSSKRRFYLAVDLLWLMRIQSRNFFLYTFGSIWNISKIELPATHVKTKMFYT